MSAGRKPDTKSCPRCSGTGLVCGHEPVITPGCCCVDYANTICPECGGSGVVKAKKDPPAASDPPQRHHKT